MDDDETLRRFGGRRRRQQAEYDFFNLPAEGDALTVDEERALERFRREYGAKPARELADRKRELRHKSGKEQREKEYYEAPEEFDPN